MHIKNMQNPWKKNSEKIGKMSWKMLNMNTHIEPVSGIIFFACSNIICGLAHFCLPITEESKEVSAHAKRYDRVCHHSQPAINGPQSCANIFAMLSASALAGFPVSVIGRRATLTNRLGTQ